MAAAAAVVAVATIARHAGNNSSDGWFFFLECSKFCCTPTNFNQAYFRRGAFVLCRATGTRVCSSCH
jgi:hypothetical protein